MSKNTSSIFVEEPGRRLLIVLLVRVSCYGSCCLLIVLHVAVTTEWAACLLIVLLVQVTTRRCGLLVVLHVNISGT
jgi:hypothetical protein